MGIVLKSVSFFFFYLKYLFTDVNTYEVMLRKIVTIQDLTLCLDKMDASGKIEVYQVLKIYLNLIQFIYKKESHTIYFKYRILFYIDVLWLYV